MPNIAFILKEEITRLARKELRSNTEGLKKSIAKYRDEIAALKRRIETLERQQERTRNVSTPDVCPEADADGASYRWSADRFAKQRARLGLSAADFAKLIGVSSLSVYKWESGQSRPRERYMPAIAAFGR